MYLVFQLYTHPEQFESDDDESEDEEPSMTPIMATVMLATATFLTAVCSEGLVSSVEGLTRSMGISEQFIGVIILPIVGNAAEHMTAVTVAAKNKMDLAIGVALGSSTQIALFVVPVTVLVGWIIDQPMDLNFHP